MQPISSHTDHLPALPRLESAGAAKPAAAETKPDEEQSKAAPGAEFRHEEPQSAGRYWVEPSEHGPAARFDPPTGETPDAGGEPVEAASEVPGPARSSVESAARPDEKPEVAEDKPTEPNLTRCSTDKVDGEIDNLRQKAAALKQQLNGETAEARQSELERQLDAVTRELAQKDNDAYRRQHAQFTDLG